MVRIWGIHNDQALDLIKGSFISIGWSELGDLSGKHLDRENLKDLLSASFPEAKAGAIPIWAGILSRFMYEMNAGDLVVSPDKASRTINIGRISGNYFYDKSASVHPNRRPVQWLKTNIPRSDLPASALNEIGSAITLFEVKRHKDLIERLLLDAPLQRIVQSDEADVLEDEPNARRVETYSRDYVEGILRGIEPQQFENLVAGVLRAMGYHADVTQLTGDGGVDVLASKDPLRLEPPTIKVQVKRTTSSIGGPAVQALIGTLAAGGSEHALFVTLGSYSNDAIHIARTRQDVRLLTGAQFIDLIFEYYEKLDAEWKRLIPLRFVHAVDRDI
jgi:restriction system protein